MKTNLFDYDLPKHFIAQNPASVRDHSKLMIYDTTSDCIFHRKFFEIGEFLELGDVLVLNRSRVIPSRVRFDQKELFLLKNLEAGKWQIMVRPGKFFKVGREFSISDVNVKVLQILSDGTRIISASGNLLKLGEAPLPPYINNTVARFSQYQTVYAREKGSLAAPTAGLHFTTKLLTKLSKLGVQTAELILHVGRGTFLPVTSERLEDHKMHEEFYDIPKKTAEILNKAKREHRRIIAVGTTSVRVLEATFKNGFKSGNGLINIFIYPGKHQWQAVDGLISNFHLPKSTLIMLVASFLEYKGVKNPISKIKKLYHVAMNEGYRFYSFGDAMFII